MQIVQKMKILLLCVKSSSDRFEKCEKSKFFLIPKQFYTFLYTFRAISKFNNNWTRYPIGVFDKTSAVSSKSASNDRKVVEKSKVSEFRRFWSVCAKLYDWLGFGIHTG